MYGWTWKSRTELCFRSHIYSYYVKTREQEDKEEKAGEAEREKEWEPIRK